MSHSFEYFGDDLHGAFPVHQTLSHSQRVPLLRWFANDFDGDFSIANWMSEAHVRGFGGLSGWPDKGNSGKVLTIFLQKGRHIYLRPSVASKMRLFQVMGSPKSSSHGAVWQGLVNVPIKHQPTIGDIIDNRYLKVMWNKSPKRDIYQPLFGDPCFQLWLDGPGKRILREIAILSKLKQLGSGFQRGFMIDMSQN